MRFNWRSISFDGRVLTWLTAASGVLVIVATVVLLNVSLGAVARQTNRIDDRRAAEELRGGVQLSRDHMDNMTEVNAVWDDAVTHAYVSNLDRKWLYAGWGALAKQGGDYDGIYLLDDNGRILWGVSDLKEMPAQALSAFSPGAQALFGRAYTTLTPGSAPAGDIVMTAHGLTIVSMGLIQPSSDAVKMPKGPRRYLMLTRAVDTGLLASYEKAYELDDIELLKNAAHPGSQAIALTDGDGATLGYLSWQPRDTGVEAARAAWPMVAGALVVIGLAVAGAMAVVIAGVRALSSGRHKAQTASLTDTLTGLPNRRAVVGRLTRAGDRDVILAVIDLDDFKLINESYGTAAGDAALQAFAGRLSGMAINGVVAARLGGDQFALMAEGGLAEQCVRYVLDRLREVSAEALEFGSHQMMIRASAGLAVRGDAKIEPEALIAQADAALEQAKVRARGGLVEYDADLDAVLADRRQIALEIVEGLAAGEFDVAYQPIVQAADGTITGVEALLRWPGRMAGAIPPGIFIEIAEHFGHIHALWSFVLRRACHDIRPLGHLTVQVNLSPAQFGDPRLLDELRAVLQETSFPASRLIVEVTEGRMIDLRGRGAGIIADLQRLGIRVALDDFGTGFSSIGSLRQFGFDQIKIDRTLCEHVVDDPRTGALVTATVALAKALSIPVTAEGVETAEQAAMLKLAGCQTLQGYFFGRPQSLDELVKKVGRSGGLIARETLKSASA